MSLWFLTEDEIEIILYTIYILYNNVICYITEKEGKYLRQYR